jgi:hypothetical protein
VRGSLRLAEPHRYRTGEGESESEGKIVNKYGAIWRELGVEVEADTTYAAQGLALPLLQAKAGRRKVKRYEITVALLQLNGVDYVHVAS